LEGIVYENFNISENNIISVELAKVLGYHIWGKRLDFIETRGCVTLWPCHLH
jgi:hypothetical protein